jgi:hypothetical protein
MTLDAPLRRAVIGACLFGGATGLFAQAVRGSTADSSSARSQHRRAIAFVDPHIPLAQARRRLPEDARAWQGLGGWVEQAGAGDWRAPGGLGEIAMRGDDASEFAEGQRQEEDAGPAPSADSRLPRGISPQHAALLAKVRRVLDFYQRQLLDTRGNNCWELMHAIVAYGVHSQVRQGGPRGPAVNSIAWLCSGAACNGNSLIYIDRGRVTAAKGPPVQGHHGQFLAILAQSKVMASYQILVGGREFTVADLIATEKLDCSSDMELTFKLIAFAHYLGSDETWLNARGEQWSIPRLIREEIRSPINGAPCGGTHRLMGLSYAVQERQRQGLPIDGEFLRAKTYIDDFHRYTFRLQNRDGSFSTEWFKRRAARDDLERRLQTSGHILEWLTYSLPESTIDEPRYMQAVAYLAGILDAGRGRKWSVGPLGHGLHALALYEERMERRVQQPLAESGAPPADSRRRVRPVEFDTELRESAQNEPAGIEREGESEAEPQIIQPVIVPAAAPRRVLEDRTRSLEDAAPAVRNSLQD